MTHNGRVLASFSAGDASFVACKLALDKYRDTHEVHVIRMLLDSEHPDNDRFTKDWVRWSNWPIIELRSEKYRDSWGVWEDRKYIAGIMGAPCTTELKKKVRQAYQLHDDIHVLGYCKGEENRADRFRNNNPELFVDFPLIDAGLHKADCHALVRATGIELPTMYTLGFENNNCIGCPKGGAGYWNMIRKHFPDRFQRMCELSRRLGARLVKQDGQRVFLDELRPNTGRQRDEIEIDCSGYCGEVLPQFEAGA